MKRLIFILFTLATLTCSAQHQPGVDINRVIGTVTVAKMDSLYNIILAYQDSLTQALRTIEQVPESSRVRLDVIANTTNQAGVSYWPGVSGLSMDGYRDLSFSGKIIEGDAVSDIVEVQVSNDDTFTDWHTIYGRNPITNTTVNNITQTGSGTLIWALEFENLNYKYFRVKWTGGDATNTNVIRSRRKAA